MKRVMYLLCLIAIVSLACGGGGVPESRITNNADKYPFLCDGFQYTIYLTPGAFPTYVCADDYEWRAMAAGRKKALWTYVNTSDREKETLPGENIRAIVHVGGSVVEYNE